MMKTKPTGRRKTGEIQWRNCPGAGVLLCGMALLAFLTAACSLDSLQPSESAALNAGIKVQPFVSIPPTPGETLPDDIEWLTNEDDPPFASPDAKPGGTLHLPLTDFPLTFRFVGPDSNDSFRNYILGNQLNLIGIHPNTLKIIPELATHWAFGKDKKTMYFKLNPLARWSDGVPVTAGDFAYTLEFMRSKYIVDPWYNDYYTQEVDRVIIYDDYTFAIVGTKAQPELYLMIPFLPLPRHFFGQLDETYVQKFNWAVVPNTGPYQIEKFKKGRYVRFKRKKDWWANDLYYFRHRFNVDTVLLKVIRDNSLQWEYFKKGRLDAFPVQFPSYWHIKSKMPAVEKGYVHKLWFFNDVPQSAVGFWMNQDREIFKERNLRYAFAHAMNVQKVISDVLHNDYFRLESGYVGYGDYTDKTIRARRYDIAKVEKYMKEAGWERGPDGIWQSGERRYSVELLYYSDEYTQRMVVFKEEAKKAGIELNLSKLDPATAFKKILEKKHEVAYMGWSTSPLPHFWEHYHSVNAHKPQTNNITNTDDPELDRLIDAFRASLDRKERIELAHKIQEKIHEIGPFVPTFMVPYFREAYWRWWRLPKVPATRSSESLFFDPFSATDGYRSMGGLFWFDQGLYDETQEAMRTGRTFEPVTIIDKTFKPETE
jgi:microcin C transport system substrate-binding protein